MRILLTGGAGFIGSHVAEHLLLEGHEVAIVDNFFTGKRENLPKGVVFYEADIRSGCSTAFEEFRPEAMSHHAAQISVRDSVREPDFDADNNIVGTLRLLRNCVKFGVKRVVFASTGGAIYGEQREYPASEDHPQYPLSPYGVSKLSVERYLYFYLAQYGLNYVALRYANVYGPKQDPHGEAGVVAIFSGNLAAGRTSRINGTGDQTRDYVYVGDVARANGLALNAEVPSDVYNIGTGIETSVNRLYAMMQEISGRDLPPVHGPAKSGEQARSSINPAKAARLMNWVPEVNLSSGLKQTLMFFEAL